MAEDIATLAIKVDARDTDKASKKLDRLTKTGKRTEKGMKSLTGSMAKMVTVVGGFVGFGAMAVGMKKVISLASDMEETQAKFNVVFRDMTEDAELWSKTLVSSYQMSGEESKRYLGSLQDLLVPTGMAREEAGAMANEFVKLAADLGSFNNLPTNIVIRDIQSALAGGSETMTKYGIDIKVATVKQEAMNLGLWDGVGAITKQARAQAVLSLAYKHSSDAVGDSIRSAGSYALQMKELQAKIADTGTAIGNKLLPKATEFITKMNDWVDQNQELIDQKIDEYAKKVGEGFKMLGEAMKFVLEHKEIIASLAAFALVAPKLAGGINLISVGFKGLAVSAGILGTSMPIVTAAIVAFGAAYKAGEWATMHSSTKGTQEAFDQLGATARDVAPQLLEISERTGIVVTSLDELEAATKAGTLAWSEDLQMMLKVEQVRKAIVDGKAKEKDAALAKAEAEKVAAEQAKIAKEKKEAEALALAEATRKLEEHTAVIATSTAFMGEAVIADELATEGMYGYKTALQLALEGSQEMDEGVTALTAKEQQQYDATNLLAGSVNALGDSYQYAYSMASNLASMPVSTAGAGTLSPAGGGSGGGSGAGSGGGGTTVNNFNTPMNPSQVASITTEQQRQGNRL